VPRRKKFGVWYRGQDAAQRVGGAKNAGGGNKRQIFGRRWGEEVEKKNFFKGDRKKKKHCLKNQPSSFACPSWMQSRGVEQANGKFSRQTEQEAWPDGMPNARPGFGSPKIISRQKDSAKAKIQSRPCRKILWMEFWLKKRRKRSQKGGFLKGNAGRPGRGGFWV